MHVDRCPGLVLEVEDLEPVRSEPGEPIDELQLREAVRWPGEDAVAVGDARHDDHQLQVGPSLQRVFEERTHVSDHRYWSST